MGNNDIGGSSLRVAGKGHTFLKRKSWDVVKSRITVRFIWLFGDPTPPFFFPV